MNHCETCHWWDRSDDDMAKRLCVWLNGIRGSRKQKMWVGKDKGNGLIRTAAWFGCVDWEEHKGDTPGKE